MLVLVLQGTKHCNRQPTAKHQYKIACPQAKGEKGNQMKVSNKVLEVLREDGFNVEAVEVKKNGVVLNGIRYTPEGSNVSPTVYVDGLTDEQAIETCRRLFRKPVPKIDNPFENFDKSRLFARIYRKGNSGTDLTREVLNLEVAAAYQFDLYDGKGSCLIHKAHAESIGIDPDELIETALRNTFADCKVYNIEELLAQLMEAADSIFEIPSGPTNMWVLTNTSGCLAAANLLNKEALTKLAETVESDLFILPSSIHEVIVVPTKLGNAEDLKAMVQEINAAEVKADEQLSDSVYRFNLGSKELVLA